MRDDLIAALQYFAVVSLIMIGIILAFSGA